MAEETELLSTKLRCPHGTERGSGLIETFITLSMLLGATVATISTISKLGPIIAISKRLDQENLATFNSSNSNIPGALCNRVENASQLTVLCEDSDSVFKSKLVLVIE